MEAWGGDFLVEVDVFPFVTHDWVGECSSSFGGGRVFEVVDAGWVVDVGGRWCVYMAEGFVVGGWEVDREGGAYGCMWVVVLIVIVDNVGVGRDCFVGILGL